MINQLNIDKRIIDQFGKYSVNTVYELANAILSKKTTDDVVFVLGNKEENICYMAIGDIDGIHVYKNKVNYNDKSSIETISKTSIFYLIKKLKQNSLQFM